jgi:histidine triad (HIT) family protein
LIFSRRHHGDFEKKRGGGGSQSKEVAVTTIRTISSLAANKPNTNTTISSFFFTSGDHFLSATTPRRVIQCGKNFVSRCSLVTVRRRADTPSLNFLCFFFCFLFLAHDGNDAFSCVVSFWNSFGNGRRLVVSSFAYLVNVNNNNNSAAAACYALRTLNNRSWKKKLSFLAWTTTATTTTLAPVHFVSGIDRSGSGRSSSTPASSSSSTSSCSNKRFMSSTGGSSDEVAKAQEAAAAAAAAGDSGAPTVFDKLLSGEWKSDVVYQDDTTFCFRDINPQAPIHIVVIPKHRDGLTQLSLARPDQEALLGHLMFVASQVGKRECPNGFRIVINDGEHGAQSVYHLHLHIIGGRQMGWPPG